MKKSVPVIDLHPFRSGGEDDRRRVARAVDEACREIGFLVLVGHGVPLDLLERAHTVARTFFDLGVEAKQKYVGMPGGFQGYRAVGSEALSYSLDHETPPDLKEAFMVGRDDIGDEPYFTCELGRSCFMPNPWPIEVPALKETWVPLYRAFDALATDVMRVFALGLDLPLHFFDGVVDKAVCGLRGLNYPEQTEKPLPGQLRAGAHTDYGTLTFVSMDDAPGGLEVDRGGGVWEEVHAPRSSLVLNIGDMMAQWTNDAWVSTYHRVANPPPHASGGTRRQSLVFFHNPNYDAEIVPLPSCCGPDRPPRYERTTAGEYLYIKLSKAGNVVAT
jgi:isopenicillin N synthase-like dioxygenase